MNLLIDIGNTNTSIAVCDGRKICARYFVHTARKQMEPAALKRLLRGYIPGIDRIIMVSVVPKFYAIVKRSLKNVFKGVPISTVGRDIHVPMKVRYKDPGEVGQDRLVTAYAALKLAGTPVLVVDFGTAVTFDLVNIKGEYEGGLIFPGIRLALGSLTDKAALLPRIQLKKMKGLIGRDTTSSMNKGILLGYASMCDGVIKRFKEKYGRKLKIAVTGGDAGLIVQHSLHMDRIYPDLIFTGLGTLGTLESRHVKKNHS